MSFGLTQSGFNRARLEDIKREIEQAVIAAYGEVNLAPDSVFGQLIGIISDCFAEFWQQMEAVYFSQYYNTAEGTSLDNATSLVGVQRLEATKSEVRAALTGDEGTLITAGSQVEVAETGEVFINPSEGVISRSRAMIVVIEPSIVANDTSYTIIINGVPHLYTSTMGTTKQSVIDGVIGILNLSTEAITATDLGDEQFEIRVDDYHDDFNIVVSSNLNITSRTSPVVFEAVNTGEVQALIGTLTEIATPVSGWASITNYLPAVLGRERETDVELRARTIQSLRIVGAGSVEAIQARIRQHVDGVRTALVFENRSHVIDSFDRPPHSFEAVVDGGVDEEIAREIWESKPAGIQTYGNTTIMVMDSNEDQQPISFSRPSNLYVWMEVILTIVPGVYPSNGQEAVQQNLVQYGQEHFAIGEKIIYQQFFEPIYEVDGITNVSLRFGTSNDPSITPTEYIASNIAIGQTEIADFNANRISVMII